VELAITDITTGKAIKQTSEIHSKYGISKLNTPYVWMIWLEILVCLLFSILCWLHLDNVIPPSFAFFFVIR
jgi:amino acid transporter